MLSAIGEFVLVEPEMPQTETKSGIFIPGQKHTGPPKVARILSIGPRLKHFDFAVGDRVLIQVDMDAVHGGVVGEQRVLRLKAHQIVAGIEEGADIK